MVYIKGKYGNERDVPMEKKLFMELYNFVLNDDMNYKKEFCFVNPTKQKPWSPTYFTDLVTESY